MTGAPSWKMEDRLPAVPDQKTLVLVSSPPLSVNAAKYLSSFSPFASLSCETLFGFHRCVFLKCLDPLSSKTGSLCPFGLSKMQRMKANCF